jgi:plastocyanin
MNSLRIRILTAALVALAIVLSGLTASNRVSADAAQPKAVTLNAVVLTYSTKKKTMRVKVLGGRSSLFNKKLTLETKGAKYNVTSITPGVAPGKKLESVVKQVSALVTVKQVGKKWKLVKLVQELGTGVPNTEGGTPPAPPSTGGGDGTPATPPGATPPTGTTPPIAPPTTNNPDAPNTDVPPIADNTSFRVGVTMREFTLALSRSAVTAGNVTVQFVNRGEDPHNLYLQKADGSGQVYKFPLAEYDSGAVEEMSFPLTAGTWRMWCALPGHDMAGMHANLTVKAAS